MIMSMVVRLESGNIVLFRSYIFHKNYDYNQTILLLLVE